VRKCGNERSLDFRQLDRDMLLDWLCRAIDDFARR
jgi:hypothetical protein